MRQRRTKLFALLYDELKRIASQQMRNETSSHTLQPTALVHEAFLRLLGSAAYNWQNRAHFFGPASEAMRRILIESARSKKSQMRGGEIQRVEMDQQQLGYAALSTPDEMLDLNDAITELEAQDADLAELKGISKSTAERRWTFAKAWLTRRLA